MTPDGYNESYLLQTANSASFGGEESLQHNGVFMVDDSGLYELIVYSASGSGCDASYEVELDFSV